MANPPFQCDGEVRPVVRGLDKKRNDLPVAQKETEIGGADGSRNRSK